MTVWYQSASRRAPQDRPTGDTRQKIPLSTSARWASTALPTTTTTSGAAARLSLSLYSRSFIGGLAKRRRRLGANRCGYAGVTSSVCALRTTKRPSSPEEQELEFIHLLPRHFALIVLAWFSSSQPHLWFPLLVPIKLVARWPISISIFYPSPRSNQGIG